MCVADLTFRLSDCATLGGNSGWTATYDGERFFLRFIPVKDGGFSLFSMAGRHVYSGTPIQR
jgi:hypothetical protein